MKKTYIPPTLSVCRMHTEGALLTGSNQVNENGINFNTGNMEPGSGDDAAVKANYSVWDDNWSI